MKQAFAVLILVALLGCVSSSVAQQPECDRACIESVRDLLRASYHGFSTGWTEKANYRLGDKVGFAVSKIYRSKRLYAPNSIRTYLPVIKEAIRYPELIENPNDRNPAITTGLLRRLKRRVRDHFLNMEITSTLNTVMFSNGSATSRE